MTNTQHDLSHLAEECLQKHNGSFHAMRDHYVTMQREAARFLNPDAPEYKTLAAKVRDISNKVRDLTQHIAATENYVPAQLPSHTREAAQVATRIPGYLAENALTSEAYTSTLMVVQAAEREKMTLDQYLLAVKNNRPERGLQSAVFNNHVEMVRQALGFELVFKSQFYIDDGRLYLKIK